MAVVAVHEPKPRQDVVEMLEGLLERARKGEIVGVAFALEKRGRVASTCWSDCEDFSVLKSGVMTLHARISMAGLEEAE